MFSLCEKLSFSDIDSKCCTLKAIWLLSLNMHTYWGYRLIHCVQKKTPTHVFFYIVVENVSIYAKFSVYVCEELGIPLKSKLNIHCYS